MDFENILEQINFDLVLEGIGTIFSFGLLWWIFLGQGFSSLVTFFITSIC